MFPGRTLIGPRNPHSALIGRYYCRAGVSVSCRLSTSLDCSAHLCWLLCVAAMSRALASPALPVQWSASVSMVSNPVMVVGSWQGCWPIQGTLLATSRVGQTKSSGCVGLVV